MRLQSVGVVNIAGTTVHCRSMILPTFLETEKEGERVGGEGFREKNSIMQGWKSSFLFTSGRLTDLSSLYTSCFAGTRVGLWTFSYSVHLGGSTLTLSNSSFLLLPEPRQEGTVLRLLGALSSDPELIHFTPSENRRHSSECYPRPCSNIVHVVHVQQKI